MSPTPSPPAWPLVARAALTRALREFFWRLDFVEVDTPVLVRAPAQELSIEAVPVAIAADAFARAHALPRFFQTSPECSMKRLIAQGFTRIFQIAPVCRDGDDSPIHRPEFRLLEWYRVDAPWTQLMRDCEDLLVHLGHVAQQCLVDAQKGGADVEAPLAALRAAPWRQAPYLRISVDDAFVAYAGFRILDASSRDLLAQRLRERKLAYAPQDTWDDLFHRAFFTWVEPRLQALGVPFFLTHFPISQAALAQPSPADPRVAERFELYVDGMELANAFGELTCAKTQRQRFMATRADRAREGRRDYPLDEPFLAAVAQMPPTSGIALGVERLLLVLLQQRDINAISFVPWHDA